MPANYLWADLARATNDPTTIDEAIAEGVAQHNGDPNAHLGADEALQSHRAAEIIDHRAESVVNDKLKAITRRYVAIVDPNDEYAYDTVQAALDYARGVGGGDILVQRGAHYITAPLRMAPTCTITGFGANESRLVIDDSNTDAIYTIGSGQTQLGNAYGAVAENGTNIVNFSTFSTFKDISTVGSYIGVRDGSTIVYRKIIREITGTSVEVDGPALTTGTAYSGQILVGLKFTAGSKYVEYLSDPATFNDYCIPGFVLYKTGYLYDSLIVSIEGVYGFYTNEAATATGETFGGDVLIGKTLDYSISDVGIECMNNDTAIYDETEKTNLTLKNCLFDGVTRLLYITNGRCTIDTCVINMIGVWELGAAAPLIMRDTEINFNTNMSTNKWSGDGVYITNCHLKSGGSGNCDIFAYYGAGGVFAYNRVTRQRSTTYVADGGTGVMNRLLIQGNHIQMYASQSITLTGRGARFVDNYISGTTSATTLATGTQFNIMTGNLSDGAFTNSGTNNIMANNQTY